VLIFCRYLVLIVLSGVMVDIDPSIIVDYLDHVEKMGKLKTECYVRSSWIPWYWDFRLCFPINPCCVHNCFDPAKFARSFVLCRFVDLMLR
jgi:hypothetical protein